MTILVADDEKHVLNDVSEVLTDAGFNVLTAQTAAAAWQTVAERQPALVVLDLKFPDCNDLSLLRRIRQEAPETAVIVLTGNDSDIGLAVSVIKLGAFDYVTKPFSPDELLNRVRNALKLTELQRAQEQLVGELSAREGLDCLIGASSAISSIKESIRRLAAAEGCVLIRGESGTGKELAARALHWHSRRRGSPFVAVNCAALPETLLSSELFGHKRGAFTHAVESRKGKFETVGDGTLFLDEIGDMPLPQQASLLRVLEDRKYMPVGETKERECRARFVLATNTDLRQRADEGRFREDLYYRINVATLTMPALRGRPEDIPELIEFFNQRLSSEMGRKPLSIGPEVMALFQKYDWPGNVRELKNDLEGALMLIDPARTELRADDLPLEFVASSAEAQPESGAAPDPAALRERKELIGALRQCRGNQTEAARLLGIHRNTVRMRIRQYGIQGPL